MRKCKYFIRRFLKADSGATAIEYGLLASILAVGVVAGANGIGSTITNMWDSINTDIIAT